DLRPGEHDAAARGRGDAPLVDDSAARVIAGQVQLSRVELGRVDAERGGHEAADVDLRALGEQHAGGVLDDHVAVAGEVPEDAARVAADHAVQRDGGEI